MNRTTTQLLISAGFLIALVLILTSLGWNDDKQLVDDSAQPIQNTTNEQPEHPHINPNQYLREQLFHEQDTQAYGQIIDAALNEEASDKELESLKSICKTEDSSIVDYCDMRLNYIQQNWTEFDQSLQEFAYGSLNEDFVFHAIEPLLTDKAANDPKPLYLNLLSSVYLHDASNVQRFMKGVRMLKDVLKLDSNNQEAIYKLAIFSVRSNQLEKAKQRFKKLISLQPENQGYRKMLEELCIETGDSTCLEELQ